MGVYSNIPQGRGMIKWAPFATMPEQFENVRKLHESNTHVPVPNLTNELQQELELKLRKLVGQNVILRYWSTGNEQEVECTIVSLDDWSETVTAVKEGNVITVEFKHVYSVDEYTYFDELY